MRYPTDNNRITSKFGYRLLGSKLDYHRGIDYGAYMAGVSGDPLWPITNNSKVVYVGRDKWRGNNVILEHSSHCTRYCHMEDVYVKVGDVVNESDVLGTMGSTGESSAAHLHFEIHKCKYKDMNERWQDDWKTPRYAIDPEKFFLEYMDLNNALEETKNLIVEVEGLLNTYK